MGVCLRCLEPEVLGNMKSKSINLNEHIKHDPWGTYIMALIRLISDWWPLRNAYDGFGHLFAIVAAIIMPGGVQELLLGLVTEL